MVPAMTGIIELTPPLSLSALTKRTREPIVLACTPLNRKRKSHSCGNQKAMEPTEENKGRGKSAEHPIVARRGS